jgi:ribosomal protein S18 acetylase RimI-like enzyme
VSTVPRALAWATDVDTLAPDAVVERRDGYLLIRSPSNPTFYWGNLLLFDEAPCSGDGPRWEELFEREFTNAPRVEHRSFGWDRTDGEPGAAREEFLERGYELDESIALVAEAEHVQPHPRANRDVDIRALDPNGDDTLWDAVLELQVAEREEGREEEESYRAFAQARLHDRRTLFRVGRGAWYVALDPATEDVTASCGIVVTAGRGRFQAVETAAAYQRRGICSRLVVEAARHATAEYGAQRFVIAADLHYHALGLYESLGFARQEHVLRVCRRP